MIPYETGIYGALLGWIPVWVWVLLVVGVLAWSVWMWLRIRATSGRGTIEQQRDRSAQWAGRRDIADLIIDRPDSRRLPLGEIVTTNRKRKR